MSTELGHLESMNEGGRVYLTQFYGGKKNGLSIQLTPSYGEHYIQLNKKQTQALVRELQNWLGENELFQKQMDKVAEVNVLSDDY